MDRSILITEDTQGWETRERIYDVPAGTQTMVITIGTKAISGLVDFSNLVVTLVE